MQIDRYHRMEAGGIAITINWRAMRPLSRVVDGKIHIVVQLFAERS